MRLHRFVPSSCGIERSVKFSKTIKTKLRNRLSDKRLLNLMYLYVSARVQKSFEEEEGFLDSCLNSIDWNDENTPPKETYTLQNDNI